MMPPRRTTTIDQDARTSWSVSRAFEDRVTGITYPNSTTNSFSYNGLDTRVGKTDSSGTKAYRRDGAYVTDPVLSDGTSTFTPSLSIRTGTASRFQHADRLGSGVRQTSASQSVTSNVRWDAFGMLASQSGTQSGPFGFAGGWDYQQDGDSGLQLLGHRYYDPSTGRFLTRDPIGDGRNWYAYCENNPLKWVDPTGEQAEHRKKRPSTKNKHEERRQAQPPEKKKLKPGWNPKKKKEEPTQTHGPKTPPIVEPADEPSDGGENLKNIVIIGFVIIVVIILVSQPESAPVLLPIIGRALAR
jgi:RHS repeat-associated protein